MSDFLFDWFKWFEKGINSLEQKEKEKFFSECGRNCANTGIINTYRKLYMDSGKKFDTFFNRLNEIDTVEGEVVILGKLYDIIFTSCLCDLHTNGYIHTDSICECSRQSVIHIVKTLEPNIEYEVKKVTTILGGDTECRFRITIIGAHEEINL